MIRQTPGLKRRLCAVVGLCVLAVGTAQAKEPKFPPPDNARVSIVNANMRINGIRSNLRQFSTKESLREVVEFYREQWAHGRSDEPGYTVTNVARPWTVVSRVEDKYLLTVQVQPTNDGGSWGFLALSRLPARGRPPKIGENFPSMRGSKTLNEIVSQDPGQSGRTMLLSNKHDLHANVAFYRNRYNEAGWAFDMDKSIGGVMHVLALRKGRQRLNMVITGLTKNGTRIIVNEVTYDIL